MAAPWPDKEIVLRKDHGRYELRFKRCPWGIHFDKRGDLDLYKTRLWDRKLDWLVKYLLKQ